MILHNNIYNDFNKVTNMTTENNQNFFDFREIIYIIYNGMAAGGIVNYTNQLIDNGYDRETLIILLMWITGFAYSANRLYDIYKTKKENRNNKYNQNQR